MDQTRQSCNPCHGKGTSNNATKHCKMCDEYLCDNCSRIHMTHKGTISHELMNIDGARMCEPCLNNGKTVTAAVVCVQCKEFICDDCCKRHKSHKPTRNHQMVSTTELPKLEPNQCVSSTEDKCKTATKFCKDCNDNLCEECAVIHKSFKMFKGHIIIESTDPLDQFLKQIRMCDPCTEVGKCKFAIKICKQCQENFCEKCCALHSRQRLTKTHQLLGFTQECVHSNKCEPCRVLKKAVEADKFCQECEEYLCDMCYNHHKAQKQTRNHAIVSAQEQSDKGNPAVCEVCRMQNKEVVATCYCVDCDDTELLCEGCAQMHKAQKLFRLHSISTDLATFHDTFVKDGNTSTEADQQIMSDEITETRPMVQSTATNTTPTDLPGKPSASEIKAGSLKLHWDTPEQFHDGEVYQIRYKDLDSKGSRWTLRQSQPSCASVTLSDMKSNTRYVFQVRVVHEDGEGPYSPQSDPVTTLESPAARMIPFSRMIKPGDPSVYALPITENRNARNIRAKTKKFEVGSPPHDDTGERIIMLVGATGTGKSTLLDGIVNYVLGVNWNDTFRFTVIIDLEDEEMAKQKNQAMSETEWITCYTLNPDRGGRLEYKLTIIDTPGFGDTRGIQRDNEIRQLFSEKGQKGVVCLDAVCFLVKAPDARLTHVQNYVFHSIMSLFGNDIESNICTLVTFADGMEPPVLAALKQSNLPFGKHFTFNNSGLFTRNVGLDSSSLSPMFWEMGNNSFRAFFDHLETMQTQSLQLTKEVLEERLKLEVTVGCLQPQIAAGLSKMDELKAERKLIEQHKTDIEANKCFEYEVTETFQRKVELPEGVYGISCMHCHITCCQCTIANDGDKRRWPAMDSRGNCTVCSDKCSCDQHVATSYIFIYESKTVKKTYAEKIDRYKKAGEQVLSHRQVVERLAEELYELEDKIGNLVVTVKTCNERLKAIALRPNPLSIIEHIDTMIDAESHEKKEGYTSRIEVLREFRRTAEIGKDIDLVNKEVHKTMKEVRSGTRDGKKQSLWDRFFT